MKKILAILGFCLCVSSCAWAGNGGLVYQPPKNLPTGAVFFMAAGACPSWTTDVSATYSNKYVKINATQLTSAGVVLTGTTDSHILTTGETPVIPVDTTFSTGAGGGAGKIYSTLNSAEGTVNINPGGGAGHTHTISGATTLEPSSITMKACQVN